MTVIEEHTLEKQVDESFALLAIVTVVIIGVLCAVLASISHYRATGESTYFVVSACLCLYEIGLAVLVVKRIFSLLERIDQTSGEPDGQ